MVGWIQKILDAVEPPNNPVAHRPYKVSWLSPKVEIPSVGWVEE